MANLIEFYLTNLTNWSKNIYKKNSVESGIMLPVPFVFIFYLVYTYYITHLYNQIDYVETDANDINQNSFEFFGELACRPECHSMRVCSAGQFIVFRDMDSLYAHTEKSIAKHLHTF